MLTQSLKVEGSRSLAVLPLYVATLFLSAFLLFSIQPLFTKMALPIVGGAPSVWSIAMVFFQTSLLAGYLYAHLLTRSLSLVRASVVHLIVTASAFSALPIAIASGWSVPPAEFQPFWLLGLFTVSLGLPFFAVAANGPLLQAWFARSNHSTSKDPYFLYAASNLGSFAALIAYPIVIEPFLTLRDQSFFWATGFFALTVFIAACAYTSYRRGGNEPATTAIGDEASAVASAQSAPGWRMRLTWLGCALVPSGLLVAVTSYISTDIAAAPLLWVVPLALFLLTFVLAFREPALVPFRLLARVQAAVVALVLLSIQFPVTWLSISLPLHLGSFLICAYMCHATLYQLRPRASHLTEFYLWLAIGGALGGIFSGLIAPNIFSTVVEYPLLIVLALACRPGFFAGGRDVWMRRAGFMAIICAAATAVWLVAARMIFESSTFWLLPVLGVYAIVLAAEWRTPYRVATVAVAFIVATNFLAPGVRDSESIRSFFGVHKLSVTADGRFRLLSHGTTIHGAMRLLEDDGTPAAGRPEPTTYYTFEGAMGSAISALREARGGRLASVSVIGLGSGSLACHAAPGEDWTFMEIDADVVRIATNPKHFRFISECAPEASIVLGDARLTLDRTPQANLIVVDAFSSDAIPAHLITREAVAAYKAKLEPDGVLVFHISNRHLELTHVLARIAAEHGLTAYLNYDRPEEDYQKRLRAPTKVLAMAPDAAAMGSMAGSENWVEIAPDMERRAWSDDYSNILEAMMDSRR